MIFNEAVWPTEDAVKIVKGNGKAKLAVFEDPNCGFCQRLDKDTLSKLNNVTIYIFLVPFLSEDSLEISRAVWNSKNPGEALMDWMVRRIAPKAASSEKSDEVFERNLQLARDLGLYGTPAIFTEDGRGPYGSMNTTSLNHLMVQH